MRLDLHAINLEFLSAIKGAIQLLRYLAPPPNLEQLQQYPPDSLGYAYAKYITESGFDPEFYRAVTINDDVSYVFMRLRQTHDIWHL
ncbi:MAG TPA: Coq4 family protein, partial [Stenomitos sp.]